MHRIRLSLPKRQEITYRNLDIIHDALVNGWVAAGASPDNATGWSACPWNFAALGWRSEGVSRVHTLMVSTPDSTLAPFLSRFDPAQVVYARARTSEVVDFRKAVLLPDPDPVAPGQDSLGVVMLSPLAISRARRNGSGPRWHGSFDGLDLAGAVNKRLSRIADRPVALSIYPDRLFLRTRSRYDTQVRVKTGPDGKGAFVVGMLAPLVLQGSEDDLRLAWHAGLGEKNRVGFGAIGLAERGVGR